MSDAAIIIPMATSNDFLWLLNTVCLRTCRATTDVDILLLGNNSPDGEQHDSIKRQCKLLGIRYEYVPGPYNMATFFNRGTEMTSGKYVVYGSADLIFYPNWLTNLLAAYEKNQDLFMLGTWGFHPDMGGLGYSQEIKYSDEVVRTHWVCTGIQAMRREDNYRFDERFPDYELDTDYHLYAKSIGRPLGIAMNSRVDHLINAVRSNVNQEHNFGITSHHARAKADLVAKWGPDWSL